MKIYPAIDIMDGQAVRLEEGKKERKEVYGRPLDFAKEFSQSVDAIHMVDLDGAFSGEPKNLSAVREIIEETELRVQFGGGIRSRATLKSVTNIGIKHPVIGTKARDLEFLEQAASEYEGLTVSLDAGEKGLMLEGWETATEVSPAEAFAEMKKAVNRFVFTSVTRDGKLAGVGEVERFWEDETAEVIYAGGVTGISDVLKLKRKGFDGAIIGKALYEGEIKLEEAVAAGGESVAG